MVSGNNLTGGGIESIGGSIKTDRRKLSPHWKQLLFIGDVKNLLSRVKTRPVIPNTRLARTTILPAKDSTCRETASFF
ncbi:hypothetical protein A4R26_05580 [Niastella populi]|uniref:Uncharacterized protein n=1 Tax=Niastella populi TaxID=550983 RepID=A0A1V9FE41_9BACT|nr:hypothetical protein A4R26_05580 [Niastella populi]